MELIVIAVAGGILLAVTFFGLLWKIISPAVDNLLDWFIHTFGNESARREIDEKWRSRDG